LRVQKDSQEKKGNTFQYGGVAQLGEHLLCKQGVIGSNPFISTKGKRDRKPTAKTDEAAAEEFCGFPKEN
jgi:hypothetical protein